MLRMLRVLLPVSAVVIAAAAVPATALAGELGFAPAAEYKAGAPTVSVSAADVNGDKRLDLIAVSRQSGKALVLIASADGTFKDPVELTAGTEPVQAATEFIDPGTTADLAVANYGSNNISLLTQNPDGSFTSTTIGPVSSPNSIALGYLDSDGRPDIAVAGADGVTVFWNDSATAFTAHQTESIAAGTAAIKLADLSGDGLTDIAVINRQAASASVLVNEGFSGVVPAAASYPAGANPSDLEIGDVNGDKKPDLIVSHDNGDLSVLLGNGDGTFGQAITTSLGAHVGAIAAITEISPIALAATLPDSGSVAVMLGKSDGTFTPAQVWPAATATADLTAVGLGLALANSGSSSVAYMRSGIASTSYDPAPIDFGQLQPGQTAASRSVVVKNDGSAMLRMLRLTTLDPASNPLFDGAPPEFPATTDCAGALLMPGQQCTISVGFAPPAARLYDGMLRIATQPSTSTSLRLLGSAAAPPLPPVVTDRVAPQLSTKATLKQRVLKTRVLVVKTRCSESCTLTATGSFTIAGKRTRLVAGKGQSWTARANQTVTMKIRFTPTVAKKLASALRAKKRVAIGISIKAQDKSHNRSTKLVRVRVIG